MNTDDHLPDNIDIAKATLPAMYSRARQALVECDRVDECKTWANKAEALRSYARQAKDEGLYKMALRIQARATRRCGELLKEIEPQQGGDRKSKGGQPPVDSRKAAGDAAGLSNHQRKTALRVANVPGPQFEEQIESDTPPTVTTLAEQGTKKASLVVPQPEPQATAPEKPLARDYTFEIVEIGAEADPYYRLYMGPLEDHMLKQIDEWTGGRGIWKSPHVPGYSPTTPGKKQH